MSSFPTYLTHRNRRRDLYDVRLAFNRIVARMRGLALTTHSRESSETFPRARVQSSADTVSLESHFSGGHFPPLRS